MKVAILSLSLIVAAGSARADEDNIAVEDLPKAVAAAVKAKFPKGKITKAAKEEEGGKTTYEVVVKVEDKTLDVAVSAKGKLLEVEQAIAAEKLPKAVASAIKAKYPKAKIKKAEQVVRFEEDEEETVFEVVLASKGKADSEVKVSPKGKILDDEDDEDDKPGKKKDKDDDDEDDKPGKKKDKD
jgi:hypothetical protein